MLKNMYADALVESAKMEISLNQLKNAAIWLEQAIVLMSDINRKETDSPVGKQRMEQARQLLDELKAK